MRNSWALRAQFRSAGPTSLNTTVDFALSKGFVFSEQDLKVALMDFPANPAIDPLRDILKIREAGRPS